MVVCRFFQQGRCKFGERCRDEHPGKTTAYSNSRNSFASLQNDRDTSSRMGEKYKLDKDIIRKDLTEDRPQYIFSAYGPGRDAPLQLFGGYPREQSFEELRLRQNELASQGRQSEAVTEVKALENDAQQQMTNALKDLDGAVKYICNGENEHPNRIDVCKTKGQASTQSQSHTNGASQPAFGQPSSTPAFGNSGPRTSFGQASSAPAFGQSSGPSTFGKPSNSAFGQSSSTPAFGQPSEPSVFGKPSTSTFGHPSAPVSAFSQVVRPTPDRFSTGTFGQPSVPAPAFGQPSNPAFGQTATFGRPTTSFGQSSSAFGQPSVQAPAFGQPSSQSNAFASQSGGTSTFGRPSSQAPAFGQPSAPSSFTGAQLPRAVGASQPGPFGQNVDQTRPSAFAPSASSFGQPTTTSSIVSPSIQAPTAPSNPFGTATSTSTGLFGRPSTTSQTPFGQSQPPPTATSASASAPSTDAAGARRPSIHLPDTNVATRDAQGNLKAWNGKEVRRLPDENWYYRDTSRSEWQRIWFPNGPPTFTKIAEFPESVYDAATKEQYSAAMKNGKFGDGGIPLIPPRKEWCNWNI